MRRTEWLRETRLMQFEKAYERWTESRLTQFGRAMGQLYREDPGYSPEARGRSVRVFRTHKDRLVKECRYADGTLSVQHGPRELARYDADGQVISDELPAAA